MKAAVTGASGFLGWHLRVRLRAKYGVETIPLGRGDVASPARLASHLREVDVVYHLAGVNRAQTEEAVETGNVHVARSLAEAIHSVGRPVHVVFANSIQAENETAYGRGKRRAAELLAQTADATGGTLADVVLPNVFGEHGRPHYNSFVATFCHEVARGRTPTVTANRPVPLLHAQDAAAALIDAGLRPETARYAPEGSSQEVADVLALIREHHSLYEGGEIPPLPSAFHVDLFNTYRSFVFPAGYPKAAAVHTDPRGDLFEAVRSHGGAGQSFVSTTAPGSVRGEHYHLRKIERFFVLKGEAEISLRRVLHGEVLRFRVTGKDRAFLDMPTMWAHNIKNVGDEPLMTLFWTDQLFDPVCPDTYRERVEAGVA